ncbi:hypothetical protein [Nocardia inohanensis]|uniref:hypothetical protein n=1 Tax=Nocardia inohanensis TaxID=209246 RepID=UPI000833E5C0|nr:hypothetical protein [Nocardia inohanensis]
MTENPWTFADPPTVAVFVDQRILRDGDWIAYVTHDDSDAAWQFHTAGPDLAHALLVQLSEVVDRDPTIAELANLPYGWIARRSEAGAPWEWAPSTPEAGVACVNRPGALRLRRARRGRWRGKTRP